MLNDLDLARVSSFGRPQSRTRKGQQMKPGYHPVELRSRNKPHGFAARTLKNLENVERAYSVGADVHVVTQLMLSLLGVVIFPMEQKDTMGLLEEVALENLHEFPWCKGWDIEHDSYKTKTTNAFILLRHVRNAVSHRNVMFSSDSRDINQVKIAFHDRHLSDKDQWWWAEIEARHLRDFCHGLLHYIVDC